MAMMQTQKDGMWTAGGELAGAVFMAAMAYLTWGEPIGFIALFLSGLQLGLAVACVSIMYERMKWNRIFGKDMYYPPAPPAKQANP